MFADLALVAIATEAMVGYPNAVYRLIGHPVTWIGTLITWCDDALEFRRPIVARARGCTAWSR